MLLLYLPEYPKYWKSLKLLKPYNNPPEDFLTHVGLIWILKFLKKKKVKSYKNYFIPGFINKVLKNKLYL